MTKQTKIKHYTKRDYAAFAYLAPWIIGMLVLQLYPFLSSLVYSFCNYKITGTPSFTGLSNYIQLFTMDNEFWNSLKVTLAYTLYTVPGKLVMALAVAVFLNRDIKGINLIRTLYYIPSLFGGSVAVALLWKIMFMDNGVINAILTTLHLPNVQWLGDPNQALRTICMMEIWQFGSSMVMFLAALKNVPADLYEAAEIDGASKVKMFFSITVPQITPIIFFNLIMQTIQALQNFTSAGRTKLHLRQIPLSDVHIPEPEIKEIRDTLASLRLDSVISSGFRIGRSLAAQYVTAGKAAIDGLPCEKPDKSVPEGAKISVRGLGKIKLAAINGRTKKDRISVVIHRYV